MPRTPVQLGPFELDAPIGRGGMGMVFHGHHREQRVPVAVKVIEHSEGDAARTFRNEIRAMVALDHPGVIWVFDVGEVPDRVTELTGGQIPSGAPYIAMEYASRGTLYDLIGKVSWDELAPTVLQLLDALAHAHARGVVHRDLKPGNVLISGPEDLRPGLKLADFGIAHAVEKTEVFSVTHGAKAIGTLNYMSPEQIRADMADYGPWTDLYALGNVVWHLLAGHVPFRGRKGMALIRAQLDLVLPDLVEVPVPSGLMEWLRRCTAKDPAERFQYAADAARELLTLGAPDGAPPRLPQRLAEVLPTVRMTRSVVDSVGGTVPLDGGEGTARIDIEEGTAPITAPVDESQPLHTLGLEAPVMLRPTSSVADAPFPGWRSQVPRRSLQLLGAGLALWGVRRLPIVGRREERDALWTALQAVHEEGRAQVVVLTGAAGTGKSRLGVWVGERAHELAVGSPLRSDRWRRGEGTDPMRQLWERYFRLGKDPHHSDAQGRRARVEKVLGRLGVDEGWDRFAPLVDGGGDRATRQALAFDLLQAVGRHRPAVVFLDDAGPDALLLAQQLLEQQDDDGDLRALVVVAVSDESLAGDDDVRSAVDVLEDRPDVASLSVGPLPERYRAALVGEMLGLAPELAAQVVERTEGNPLFTVQLISDWIQRDVLELGPTGFRVRTGARLSMPSTMAQVWEERVRQVLLGERRRAGTLLERAAVLGIEVDQREWRIACDDPDGSWARAGRDRRSPENDAIRSGLVDKLAQLRLAEITESGFRFAHGMLREALIERARRERRLGSHHRACAAMLRATSVTAPERLGKHLLGGGELEAAIAPLLEGVQRRQNTTGYRSALSLLGRAEKALRDLALPATDTRWAEVWNLRATLYTEMGELDQAERWALRVLAHGDRPGWASHAVRSRLALGLIHLSRGEWREAAHEFNRVCEVASDPIPAGWAMAYRALLAGRAGQGAKRKEYTANAVRLLRRAGSSRALASCWHVVGVSCRMEGQYAQAEESLSRSLRLNRKMGALFGQAESLAELGEVARARGDRDIATQRYLEAIHLYEITGSARVVFPRLHLAIVRLHQRRFRDARTLLVQVRLQLGRQGRELAVGGLPVFLMAAAAGLEDWEEFDHQLRQAEAQRGRELSADAQAAADLAAELAGAAGRKSRVARASRLVERARRG